ncbi:MAG: polyprenyl synthetase family protein [Simkaniaceae bacterium]
MSIVSSKVDASFLAEYQARFNAALQKSLFGMGEKNKLRDACEYALMSGGKRFRPIITLLIAESLGSRSDVMQAALSIEYMHTASLIIDDLPCMDDDEFRRGKPCLHKVFGETTALLASYTLVNLAYEKIYDAASLLEIKQGAMAQKACMTALGEASRAAGFLGATGGQFFDLFPPEKSLAMIRKVIYQKTVCLFEIAFLFGWIFGGGDFQRLDVVKNAAAHFGMAFQIADDLQDQKQDRKRSEEMNIALFLGIEKAHQEFDREMALFEEKLSVLSIDLKPFLLLKELMIKHKNSFSYKNF